jgi:hypothetical protein
MDAGIVVLLLAVIWYLDDIRDDLKKLNSDARKEVRSD